MKTNYSMSSFLMICTVSVADDEDELGLFLEPLELHSKQRIFLAINDNTELDSAGGSHWWVETNSLCWQRLLAGCKVYYAL